jgi:hypothetical protein
MDEWTHRGDEWRLENERWDAYIQLFEEGSDAAVLIVFRADKHYAYDDDPYFTDGFDSVESAQEYFKIKFNDVVDTRRPD